MRMKVLRIAEALIVLAALGVLLVRWTESEAYRDYCRADGSRSFWSWFAKDKCGVDLPRIFGLGGQDGPEAENDKEQAKAKERQKRLKALEAKERELQKAAAEAQKRLEAATAKMVAAQKSAAAGKKGASKSGKRSFAGSSGTVKTGGKSSYQAAGPGQMYRVNGIRGIEFGSTDNAPTEGVKPLLSVSYDADGNAQFRQLKWRENRKLSDKIYGFDQALLDHTYDSGQLSEVTLHKKFPMTEEGVRQAMEFYSSMSDAASQDLGFDVIDIDRTGNTKSATICEFTNKDGETAIRGAVSAWNDNSLTVTLKVQDKGYTRMQKDQSAAAYDRGDPGLENARVEVWNKDYSSSKGKVNAFLAQ